MSAGERSAGGALARLAARFREGSGMLYGSGSQVSAEQASQQRPSGAPGVLSPKWSSSIRRLHVSEKLNFSTAR